VADPVVHSHSYDLADLRQGKAPVLADQVDHTLFAKLAKIIFRICHTVAVGDKNFAGMHLDSAFVVGHVVEQSDYRSATFQAANGAVLLDQDGGQVPTVAVGEVM